jgi:predicted TIM-barrel fold metal-dependent hydrolase
VRLLGLAALGLAASALAKAPVQAPRVDHHQHLLNASMVAQGQKPIDARVMIGMLDEAGIQRAVLLSNAFRHGNPTEPTPDEYSRVMAENDWTAREAAKYPKRLVALCSFNPLKNYAIDELNRCTRDKRFGRGIKLQLGWAMVNLDDPANVAAVRDVFAEANRNKLAIVVHLRTRERWPYGAAQAQVFLDQILSAAPDVTVQIAHLAGGGGGSLDPGAEEALSVFTTAIAKGDPRVANLWFDVSGITGGADAESRGEVIAQHLRDIGVAHLLYGSDGGDPTDPPASDAHKAFRKLPLARKEFRAIDGNVAPYVK